MIRSLAMLMLGGALALSACNGGSQVVPSDGQDVPVARIGEETITQAELDAWIKDELWKDQTDGGNATRVYALREQGLERMVDKRLVDAEAKKRGLEPDALLDAEAAKRVAVSDADVRAYFDQNQAKLSGETFESLAPRIRQYLERSKGTGAAQAFVAELRAAAKVEMLLERPRIQVAAEGHASGPADAPITLIEFSDYECPFCRRAEPVVQQVLEEYAGKVRFVYRHYPLESIHPRARGAAEAAACAEEQGRFWEYHAQLFADNAGLAPAQLESYAGQASLDLPAFKACVAEHRSAKRVEADVAAGEAAGVTGTPAFFLNGIPLSGAQPIEEFRRLIDAELQRAAKEG